MLLKKRQRMFAPHKPLPTFTEPPVFSTNTLYLAGFYQSIKKDDPIQALISPGAFKHSTLWVHALESRGLKLQVVLNDQVLVEGLEVVEKMNRFDMDLELLEGDRVLLKAADGSANSFWFSVQCRA